MRSRFVLPLALALLFPTAIVVPISSPAVAQSVSQTDSQLQKGIDQFRKGEYPQALKTYQSVLEQSRKTGDRAKTAQVLSRISELYYWLQNGTKAVEAAQQSLVLYRELKDRSGEADALNSLGLAYYRNQAAQADKALPPIQQALEIYTALNDTVGKSTSLSILGLIQKDVNKSIEYHTQAIALQQNDRYLLSVSYLRLAITYNTQKNRPQMLAALQQAVNNSRAVKARGVEAYATFAIAAAYIDQKQYDQALTASQQALSLLQTTGLKSLELTTRIAIGAIYAEKKQYKLASAALDPALALAIDLKDKESLSTLRGLYSGLGSRAKTIVTLEQFLSLETVPIRRWLALGYLIDEYKITGNYRKLLTTAQQLLTESRGSKIVETYGQAIGTVALGIAQSELAVTATDYQTAIATLQQGLKLSQNIKNAQLEIYALEGLSNSYRRTNDYQKALEFSQQIAKVAEATNNINAQLLAATTLGDLYLEIGDYQQAEKSVQDSLVTLRRVLDQGAKSPETQARIQQYYPILQAVALTFSSMNAYFNKGDYQKMVADAEQSVAILAKLSTDSGDAKQWERFNVYNYLFLGFGYNGLKNYPKAIDAVQKARTIIKTQGTKGSEAGILGFTANIYRHAGQTQQAIDTYNQALAIVQQEKVAGDRSIIKVGLARSYRDLNLPTTAIAYYKQAVEEYEQVRKKNRGLSRKSQEALLQSFADIDRTKAADIYRELANLLITQGRLSESQQILELLKIQELEDSKVSKTPAPAGTVTFNKIEDQIRQQNGTLVAVGQKLDECEKASQNPAQQCSQLRSQRQTITDQYYESIRKVENQLRENRNKDDNFLDPKDLLSLNVRELLKQQPDSALVYVLVLEDKIWLLMATKGNILQRVEVKVSRAELTKTVTQFRDQLKSPGDVTTLNATSQKLHSWLIQPLEKELQAGKVNHLVFALDRVTRYIPMAALYDGKQYLIERYTVATILSAAKTNFSTRLPADRSAIKVLGMGLSNSANISAPVPGTFPPLGNVPLELNAIVRKNRGDSGIFRGEKFLNQDFTVNALRDNLYGHQILHLATHGLFVPDRPDASFILLGNGQPFSIRNIESMQDLAQVHLITLSACETALGSTRDQDGLEIAGVSSYFLGKASSVLATLWSVNDRSTRQLMETFYKTLSSSGRITQAAALRQAQLSLLQSKLSDAKDNTRRNSDENWVQPLPGAKPRPDSSNLAHPYYWAPFTLIGNSL